MHTGFKKVKITLLILLVILIISGAALAAAMRSSAHTLRVLIVGDSIGEGAGASDPSLKWYKYLIPYMKDAYGVKLDITNVSMGGNSSYAGYTRVMELEDGENYDLAIICYGENDQVEGFSLYYESILWAICDKYPSCRLITILESSQQDYTEKIRTIESLSAHYGADVADTIAAFKDSKRPYEELCDDGTHPNDAGQMIYYETVKAVMDAIYSQENMPEVQRPDPLNPEVAGFKNFSYYPAERFEKTEGYAYELEMKLPAGRLGIDYTTVKGVNMITLYADEKKICEKEIGWNNDFTLDFIEVMEDRCEVNSKIRIEFSSKEQMEAFHGIIVNEYEVSG
ncbi:MAG: SGNH/GDSL hydrolase family protein [Lachnospiraceae bacterium]|nr:SGNH/GDSL hydrolase family protein [Lachnospiraceae bacterium]